MTCPGLVTLNATGTNVACPKLVLQFELKKERIGWKKFFSSVFVRRKTRTFDKLYALRSTWQYLLTNADTWKFSSTFRFPKQIILKNARKVFVWTVFSCIFRTDVSGDEPWIKHRPLSPCWCGQGCFESDAMPVLQLSYTCIE